MISSKFKKTFFLSIIFFCFLDISYGAQAQGHKDKPKDEKRSKSYQSYDELFDLYQPYLKNVKAYEPIYFLVGANPEKSKLQFSFRYQLFNKETLLAQSHDWLQGLNFGYTQTSFWDLKSTLQPFKDTSYKPEVFFLSSNLTIDRGSLKGIFLQTGLQHESNGQADASRSTNIFYLKPICIFYNQDSLIGLQIAPKAWAYVGNDDDTNPDLKDYRGYFDLELKFGKKDSLILESHFRPAKEGNSLQLDLTYPIQKYLANNIGVYIHAQYVNSLAENMLNYQGRTEAFRMGISLIR